MSLPTKQLFYMWHPVWAKVRAYQFSCRITVLCVNPNLKIFRQNTCELDIVYKFELQCIFQVSASQHQRDVYVVLVTKLLCAFLW
jgi:hypothetical protein